ncbi:MAG TPA: HPP family protein [Terriglobales bacterium]|nr:HPP family protein [Terriglobales bacterium]
MNRLVFWLSTFWPRPMAVSWRERLRGCIGAAIGIAVTGFVTRWALGPDANLPLLIAPMGASAVLLYAVPASPLAQPWSIIGGNLVAGLIGITCAQLIQDPMIAASLAIGFSIGAMFALRCIHPPSGAVALTAVIGGPVVHALGYKFMLVPLGINSFLLLGVALLYNNLTRHRYPHHAPAPAPAALGNVHRTGDLAATNRVGFVPADLDDVLQNYGELIDVDREDLEQLFLQTEMHVYRRRFGDLRCRDIMSRDIVQVAPATSLAEAWQLLRRHRLSSLPVVDPASKAVTATLELDDFLHFVDGDGFDAETGLLRRFRQLWKKPDKAMPRTVQALVATRHPATQPRLVAEDRPIIELVPLLADGAYHQVYATDQRGGVTGLVTLSDLVAGLYRAKLTGQLPPAEAYSI